MSEETHNFYSDSRMLGRIAAMVEDFFETEETTTEEAVVLLLARYHQLKSNAAYDALEKMQEDRNSPTNKSEKQ